VDPPDVHYARSGDLRIAYQILGDGPIDVVHVPGTLNNIEAGWQEPSVAGFWERCAEFSRLIILDRRGSGLSDRVTAGVGLSIEERSDDVRAVMDAAGSREAAVFAAADAGQVGIVHAATYPERTSSLLLAFTAAHRRWASLTYEYLEQENGAGRKGQRPAPSIGQYFALLEDGWGTGITSRLLGVHPRYRRNFARMERLSGTPTAAVALTKAWFDTDLRAVLPTIRVPTLVIHAREHPFWSLEEAQYLVGHIEGARLAEISTVALVPGFDTDPDELPGIIEEFLTGSRTIREPDRALKTVLFTDVVGSTDLVSKLGDRRWRALLEQHDAAIREQLARGYGKEIKRTGDGFLAIFDGPARAVRCAQAIVRRAQALGLDVRAGLHTGECELLESDIGGIAVHIGARICALAGPSEVLATRTVKDLTAGAGLQFADRGEHNLKGVTEPCHVYAVDTR
jgi:class 3 adenylate cyclase